MNLQMPPIELAQFLSLGKAESVAKENPGTLVVAADTFIVYKNKLLGKPKTADKATEMLAMLSGQEHEVISGVTIIDGTTDKKASFYDVTKVFMRTISKEEIEAYVESGEPLDKAGAYGIQGLGGLFISKIEGDYFNVMGLPISRVAEALQKLGVKIF